MRNDIKKHLLKSLKIAVAALLSIFIAGEMGLAHSATAGIITVLSIGRTKRETFRSAANRGMAYICALVLAVLCFKLLGYTLPGFALYLFLFAFLCMAAGWQEAITTDSVLISHFLNEGSMDWQLVGNETMLFIIGVGLGILVNLHLHSKEADFEKLAEEVDGQMKGILRRMCAWLQSSDKSGYDEVCFVKLEEAIRQAKLCAAANYNNSLFRKNTGELDYIRMREQQAVVLKGIYQNIKSLAYLPGQAAKVAAFFAEVEQGYHKENTVAKLLGRLREFLEEMKQEQLPADREEFEARAILFYILMQMEELLQIKWRFIVNGRQNEAEERNKIL